MTTSPWRALSGVVLAAIFAGACDPGARSSPTPAPSPTPIAIVPTPSPQPSPTCRLGPFSPISASLRIRTLDFVESVDVGVLNGRALETPAPSASFEPIEHVEIGRVLGGAEIEATLVVDAPLAGEPSPTITGAIAKIQLDGDVAQLVEIQPTGDVIRFQVPDLDGSGALLVSLSWSYECGHYGGLAATRLTILPSSVADGCPMDDAAAFDAIAALQDVRVRLGTIELPIGINSWTARWTGAFVIDDFPQLAPWDREIVLTLAPAASIVLKDSREDLVAVSARAATYRLDEVVAWLDPSSSEDLLPIDVTRHQVRANGTIVIPGPLEPGDYVLEVQGMWQTGCFDLGTYTVVTVRVR